jgi:hypothetical protein
MTTTSDAHTKPFHPRRPALVGAVVEPWWCPVCDRATPHIYRAGRPRIYCSNACRQRAYRFRRRHRLRTTATTEHPAESARVSFGRTHALRARGDFMSSISDQRRRRVTVCGVLAWPSRYTKLRHFDFLVDFAGSCRTCVRLVTPHGQPVPPVVPPDWQIAKHTIHRYLPGSPASFDEPTAPTSGRCDPRLLRSRSTPAGASQRTPWDPPWRHSR